MPPILSISATPDTIYLGESSQLLATEELNYTYDWFPPSTLNNPAIFNPIATPEETTDYELTIMDEFGCFNNAFITVVVLNPDCEEPFVFMPNAFSPNGDGENDILKVEGRTVEELYLAIYNRWGELVFETSNPTGGWDGVYNGELSEPDVYGYYLKVKCTNGQEHFLSLIHI